MDAVIGGLVGGLFIGLINIYVQNKIEHFRLIERRLNILRDEISEFLGLSEELRLKSKYSEHINLATEPIYPKLMNSSYKIKFYLAEEDKCVKKQINSLVDELRKIADQKSSTFTEYEKIEKELCDEFENEISIQFKKIHNSLKNLKHLFC